MSCGLRGKESRGWTDQKNVDRRRVHPGAGFQVHWRHLKEEGEREEAKVMIKKLGHKRGERF